MAHDIASMRGMLHVAAAVVAAGPHELWNGCRIGENGDNPPTQYSYSRRKEVLSQKAPIGA